MIDFVESRWTTPGVSKRSALLVATVSKSLALQAPAVPELLRRQGFEVTFAAAHDSWSAGLHGQGNFAAVDASRSLRPSALVRTARQYRSLSRGNWDLIQVQAPIAAGLWRLISQSRSASIYIAHGFHFHRDGSPITNAGYAAIEGALAGRTSALALVSAEDFKAALRLRLDRRTLVWRLPGAGVDLDALTADGAPTPPLMGPYALFVGDLNANKDPLHAVKVVQAMRERGWPGRLVIIGEGPLGTRPELAASDWVLRIDRTNQVPRWMRHASLLLAPSRREGLPRVVIEALAVGVPVLARANRGTREILPLVGLDPLTSLDVSTWVAHADAMLRAGRSLLPSDSHERLNRFSVESFRDSYTSLIKTVLGASTRARGAVPLEAQTALRTS